jgi:hypothetical protein
MIMYSGTIATRFSEVRRLGTVDDFRNMVLYLVEEGDCPVCRVPLLFSTLGDRCPYCTDIYIQDAVLHFRTNPHPVPRPSLDSGKSGGPEEEGH